MKIILESQHYGVNAKLIPAHEQPNGSSGRASKRFPSGIGSGTLSHEYGKKSTLENCFDSSKEMRLQELKVA
jgi:hypothetical protein